MTPTSIASRSAALRVGGTRLRAAHPMPAVAEEITTSASPSMTAGAAPLSLARGRDVGPAGRDYRAAHAIAADAAGKPEGRGPVVGVIRAAQRWGWGLLSPGVRAALGPHSQLKTG